MTIESFRDDPQPEPVDERYLSEAERILGVRFPDAYRERMLKANGGLVRTGSRYWKLQPVEHPFQPLPRLNLWADRNSLVLYAFKNERHHDGRRGLAFAVSVMDGNAGDSLYMFTKPEDPHSLSPEVWRWGFVAERPVKLLDHVKDVWTDDPFKTVKPRLNWKLRSRKMTPSAAEKTFRLSGRKASTERPLQSGWLDLVPFPLGGDHVFVGDLAVTPSEGDKGVRLGRGDYLLQAQAMAFGQDIRFSRVRLIREKSEGTVAELIEHVDVDVAAVTFHDMDQVRQCEDSVLMELSDRLMDVSLSSGYKAMTFGPTTLATISSGFGDGTYPVYAVRARNGDLVGIALEFIPDGTSYESAGRQQALPDADDDLPYGLQRASRWGSTGKQLVACIESSAGHEKWERMNDLQVAIRDFREFPLSGPKVLHTAKVAEGASNFLEHMNTCRCHLASALRLMEECHGAASIVDIQENCRAVGAADFANVLEQAMKSLEATVVDDKRRTLALRLAEIFDEYPWRQYEQGLRDLLPAAQLAWEKYASANLAEVDFIAEYRAVRSQQRAR